MSESRMVPGIMEEHVPTFNRRRGCRFSKAGAIVFGSLFLLGIIATGLLVYHLKPCADGKAKPANDQSRPVAEGCLNNTTEKPKNASVDAPPDPLPSPTPAETSKPKLNTRLPRSVVPDSYAIKLMPFIWEGNFTFNGEVTILVNVTENTKNITLHMLYLDVLSHEIKEVNPASNVTKKITAAAEQDTERAFYILKTGVDLKAGKQYMVNLRYIGYLKDDLRGFYRSSYVVDNQTRWIATTFFQPTDARRAFPCFDEPSFKAKFQISVARPTNMTSLSNMLRKGESLPAAEMPNYVWDHYEQSVPMSTYLVAIVVSDFADLHTTANDFGVWARPGAIDQARYALNIGPRLLGYYEKYFDIPFPLPKMDMIALPDLLPGAMEHWGLITFKEVRMLHQTGVSPSNHQFRTIDNVAHELSHQWFGNLVTPSWWSDLWLNEGFATYMEYVAIEDIEPQWKSFELFINQQVHVALTLDALASSHPIFIEVGHPDEITEIFDQITYSKAASIIRMMEHFLTTKVFKQGLTTYLKSNSYRSAEHNVLWEALDQQAHMDKVLPTNVTLKQIMDTWILQTGFPVVTITRNYTTGEAKLSQDRFSIQNATNDTQSSDSLWWVPITYTTEGLKNFTTTTPSHWMKAEKSLTITDLGAAPDQWVVFNIQETGFYRVNYDKDNWEMIIKQLQRSDFGDIPTINRGQLIDDSLNLAQAGRLNYETALDMTTYLANETEYLPWTLALKAINHLDGMLFKFLGYDRFRIHIRSLLDTIYHRIGFEEKSDDSLPRALMRIDILTRACNYDHTDCVANAAAQFKKWRETPNPDTENPISPNLRGVIYCSAIRTGNLAEWDFAWERYVKTNVGSEKELLLDSLGCSREAWILNRYLEWATEANSKIRKQDATRVFIHVAKNPIGHPLVFSYLKNYWPKMMEYAGTSLTGMVDIFNAVASQITTKQEFKELVEFQNEHKKELGQITRAVQQAVEQAAANLVWVDLNYEEIKKWLVKTAA